MRVHVDPKTGKLVRGAVAARARELSPRERNMVSRSADGLTARTLPNGTVALNLSGRFRNLIRVELGEDEAGLKTVCLINDPSTDSGNPGSP